MKMKKNSMKSVLFVSVIVVGLSFVRCASSSTGDSVEKQQVVKESYFVCVDGNDDNNGLSETDAFKTLSKAIQMAKTGTVKQIIVIGTINSSVTINNSGTDEILISGKQNETGQALLTSSDSNVLTLKGNSNIKLENIGVTGGNKKGGIILEDKTILTLGVQAKIYGNTSNDKVYSGGITVFGSGATLIIQSDAEVTDNKSENIGGGITSVGTVIIKNNAKISGNFAGTNGGGIFFRYGTVTVQDNATISTNTAKGNGGAIYGEFFFRDNGGGQLIIKDNAIISNNRATNGGGLAINDIHNVGFVKEGGIIYGSDVSAELSNKASVGGSTLAVGSTYDENLYRKSDKTLDKGLKFKLWDWNWLK
jgi:predicted outer membrane repeat protein